MSEKTNNDALGSIPTPADFFGWLNQVMAPMAQATTALASNIPTPADPLTMWRSYTEKNEEIYSKLLQQLVSTPAFAQGLGRSASATARYRDMVKQAAKLYLETADMPTREDISSLAAQVVALDAKVDDLSDSLSDDFAGIPQLVGKVVVTLEAVATRLELLESFIISQSLHAETVITRLERLEVQLNQSGANADLVRIGLERLESQLGQNGASAGEIFGRLERLENQLNQNATGLGEIFGRLEGLGNQLGQNGANAGEVTARLERLEDLLNQSGANLGEVFNRLEGLGNQVGQNGANLGEIFGRLERLEGYLNQNGGNTGEILNRLEGLEGQIGQNGASTGEIFGRLERLENQSGAGFGEVAGRIERLESQLHQNGSGTSEITGRLERMENLLNQNEAADGKVSSRLERIETQLGQPNQEAAIVEKLAQIETQISVLESQLNAAVPTQAEPAVATSVPVEEEDEAEITPKRAARSRKKPATTTEPITES